jgi:hypothetical protein
MVLRLCQEPAISVEMTHLKPPISKKSSSNMFLAEFIGQFFDSQSSSRGGNSVHDRECAMDIQERPVGSIRPYENNPRVAAPAAAWIWAGKS